MIVAVDFDGTLWTKKTANVPLIARLRALQKQGHTVILWSCREGASLCEALSILRENGFVPNFVNQNAPDAVARLRHDPRKIFADVYIDDKGVKP